MDILWIHSLIPLGPASIHMSTSRTSKDPLLLERSVRKAPTFVVLAKAKLSVFENRGNMMGWLMSWLLSKSGWIIIHAFFQWCLIIVLSLTELFFFAEPSDRETRENISWCLPVVLWEEEKGMTMDLKGRTVDWTISGSNISEIENSWHRAKGGRNVEYSFYACMESDTISTGVVDPGRIWLVGHT